MRTYAVDQDGIRLDRVVLDAYGTLAGAYEAVIEANPGLAGRVQALMAGDVVSLPSLPNPVQGAALPQRLFD